MECYKEALDECEKAIKENPNDSHAWTFQGFALFMIGWYDKSLKSLDKVIEEINLEFDYAWYLRGYVTDYLGKHKEALFWEVFNICRPSRLAGCRPTNALISGASAAFSTKC